jgi:hypothetical protein
MLDDRRRLAERSARVSDPGALVRFVTEEGRLVMLTSYVLGPARGTDTPLWQGALRGRS